ncbi:MAG: ABC transporter ATP-binding protein [Leptospiraceae bacterium]|nr:ABC transporter ATP-binding protein [Leptospiraceae bacterium]
MSLSLQINELIELLARNPEAGIHELPKLAALSELTAKEKSEAISFKLDFDSATPEEQLEIASEVRVFLEGIAKKFSSDAEDDSLDDVIVSKPVFFQKKSDIVFSCENVTKKFKNFKLSEVNLTLRTGEITGVVGENSNGKTTLFRLVIGETAPDGGNVKYPLWENGKGKDWTSIKSKIAYVAQDIPAWNGNLKDNLHFEAAVRGIPADQNEIEVDYILNRLGLKDYVNRSWNQLSGGYKLRFSLAKALVWKPSLLVIDEPLAYLDIRAQLVVLNDIRELARSYKYPIAVLISSQHLREIEKVADNLVYLKKGEVLYNGKVSEFLADEKDNVFVMDADISVEEMSQIFTVFPASNVMHNGFEFIITTQDNVSKFQVLELLVRRRVNIRYFRDITRSIERRFK